MGGQALSGADVGRITCKGAYIKLANGEVEIGSPKLVRVKAPIEVSGGKGRKYPIKNVKNSVLTFPIFITHYGKGDLNIGRTKNIIKI